MGFPPKLKIKKAMAIKTTTFKEPTTKEKNTRKLYITIVRPQLLYPILPLNSRYFKNCPHITTKSTKKTIKINRKHNTKRKNLNRVYLNRVILN